MPGTNNQMTCILIDPVALLCFDLKVTFRSSTKKYLDMITSSDTHKVLSGLCTVWGPVLGHIRRKLVFRTSEEQQELASAFNLYMVPFSKCLITLTFPYVRSLLQLIFVISIANCVLGALFYFQKESL